MTEIRIEVHGLNFPPRQLYQPNRKVTFIGGEGIVPSSSFEGETWKYLVKMPQGTKPTFSARRSANGRVGAETMVLLNERELCAV